MKLIVGEVPDIGNATTIYAREFPPTFPLEKILTFSLPLHYSSNKVSLVNHIMKGAEVSGELARAVVAAVDDRASVAQSH